MKPFCAHPDHFADDRAVAIAHPCAENPAPFGAPNPGISCSVCGHIHAHSDESSVNLDRRYCGDCGVCRRAVTR